jgi:hypothetical protein
MPSERSILAFSTTCEDLLPKLGIANTNLLSKGSNGHTFLVAGLEAGEECTPMPIYAPPSLPLLSSLLLASSFNLLELQYSLSLSP